MRFSTISCYFQGVGSARIEAKNPRQKRYQELLANKKNPIVFAVGPSGTGKTLLACEEAIRSMDEKRIDKIILTRPAVYVGEEHGFLPGSLNEKLGPWFENMFEVFEDRWGADHTLSLFNRNKIVLSPLGMMRGKTFRDSFVIADEMQNSTPTQMKMFLTRIGPNSRIVVTGDVNQHDRVMGQDGLSDVLMSIGRSEPADRRHFSIVEFETSDVERHPIIRDVLRLYGEF